MEKITPPRLTQDNGLKLLALKTTKICAKSVALCSPVKLHVKIELYFEDDDDDDDESETMLKCGIKGLCQLKRFKNLNHLNNILYMMQLMIPNLQVITPEKSMLEISIQAYKPDKSSIAIDSDMHGYQNRDLDCWIV